MQIKLFDSYFAQGSASGARTYQVTNKGKIIAISWGGLGIAASATACGQAELSRSGLETVLGNDPQGVVSQFAYSAPSTGGTFTPLVHIGMSEVVSPGERLFINILNKDQFTNKSLFCIITIA